VDGQRRKISGTGFAKKRDAQKALVVALAQYETVGVTRSGRLSTGDYLTAWLDEYRRSGKRKATTIESTTVAVNAYLIPRIGSIPLAKLDADRVARLYADLLENGRLTSPGGLSAKTVRNVAGVLHKALSDAVKRRKLPTNPADSVELPTWKRPDLNVWDDFQAGQFLRHVEQSGDPCGPLWRLLLATGMRRGELLGLRWADVDLVNGEVRVEQSRTMKGVDTPKTKRGRRKISVDRDTVDALARLKDAQEAAAERFGNWTSEFVATDLDGRPIQPLAFTRRFQAAAKRAGLPVPRLHDGRHTAATLALQAGIPIQVVAGRLGHEHVSTTLDVYAAFLPTADRVAADQIGSVLTTRIAQR
jgi:integrase